MSGASVRAIGRADLALWISEMEGNTAATVERLREHERVVRAALATATPLPLRYGTVFRDTEAALRALDQGRVDYLTGLDRVRDQVEMSLRVELGPPDANEAPTVAMEGATTPGRQYLERRRSELDAAAGRRHRAEQILKSIEVELQDLDLPTVRDPDPRGGTFAALAHLVHRHRLRSYRQRVEQLQKSRPDLRISVTGPWAPYSFV